MRAASHAALDSAVMTQAITREWRFLFEWAIDSKLARLGGGVGSTY